MRLFIAIDYTDEVKDLIQENVNIIKPRLPRGIKWVEKENYHITFKFLGDVSKNKIDTLSEILEDTTKQFYSFAIQFGNLAVIPNARRPRILWYDMVEKTGIANNIFRILEQKLVQEDFKKAKRPLSLHTTLARIKYPMKVDWKAVFNKTSPITKTINCSSLTLFKSKLTQKGPLYSIMNKFNFSKK
ncbi:MAG: RNA 2',3'-cyclic phosphodiesterase [Candidatus Cloacimonetes bacterium]|nr:RNA 2',3'-cyclic phosphodiesterase [Candidatus Cloacimonadota bacterium]